MVAQCSIEGCKKTVVKGSDLKLYSVPTVNNNRKMQQKWLAILGITSEDTKNIRICNNHFRDSDFLYTDLDNGAWKELRPNAVPSQNLPRDPIHITNKRNRTKRRTPYTRFKVETDASTAREFDLNEMTVAVQDDIQFETVLVDKPIINSTLSENKKIEIIVQLCPNPSPVPLEKPRKFHDYATQTTGGVDLVSYSKLDDSEISFLTGMKRAKFDSLYATLCSHYQFNFPSKLSSRDQVLVTLIKYRHNLTFLMLSCLFRVSQTEASDIFRFVTSMVHNTMTEVNSCKASASETISPSIDCFEVPIERSVNIENRTITYSPVKKVNTFKALIAMNEDGEVVFVSEAFGGSISNRDVAIKSEFLQNLEPGDSVWSRSSFEIGDILKAKQVEHNIVFHQRQALQPNEIKCPINNHRRMMIESTLGRVRANKILTDTLPHAFWTQASSIIYNCFMLNNSQLEINSESY